MATESALDLDGKSGVVVLLVGQTGVGKSQFINVAAGEEIAPVYHGLADGSRTVEAYRVRKPSLQDHADPEASVILVDTPGLDNYCLDDLTVLQKIQSWIADRCNSDVKFGGILYLKDITSNRVRPIERLLSLERPERLLLVTSNWDQQRPSGNFERRVFEKREQFLLKVPWKKLLDTGAKYHRFLNTRDTAWGILDEILQMDPLPVHILDKDLKKIQGSLPGRKKKPQWQITIRDLLPSMGSTVARAALSKDDQSRAEPIGASAGTVFAVTPHRPDSSSGTVIYVTDLSSADTTPFDTESILSTDTGFFSAIEAVDPEEEDGLRTASPEPIRPDETESVYTIVEVETSVTLSISQLDSPIVVSSVSNVPASTATSPQSDSSTSQVPFSASTTIPPAPTDPESPSEGNILPDIEGILLRLFPSADIFNIQNLHITVNVINQDVPPNPQ